MARTTSEDVEATAKVTCCVDVGQSAPGDTTAEASEAIMPSNKFASRGFSRDEEAPA